MARIQGAQGFWTTLKDEREDRSPDPPDTPDPPDPPGKIVINGEVYDWEDECRVRDEHH